MPQSPVIKRLQYISGYLVDIPHSPDLRVHALHILRIFSRRKIKLMAHKYVSLQRIDIFPPDQPPHCIAVGKIVSVFIRAGDHLHHGRLHEGKKVEVHFPEPVFQRHFFDIFILSLRRQPHHVEILPGENIPETVHPGGAVMVSADHHNRPFRNSSRKVRDKMIEHLHRLCGGNRLVINVSRDHNRVRLYLRRFFHDLMEDVFLILAEIAVH